MNTPWNTRLAAAFASALTTLALLHGLVSLAGSAAEPATTLAKPAAPAATAVVVARAGR
jgi:hypothetical protein